MDTKKLRRAAVEPARVFGRRDFDNGTPGPLHHYDLAGTDYWSPNYPTWLIIDGDCGVLEKALKRYGSVEAPVSGRWPEWVDRMLEWQRVDEVSLAGPDEWTLRNGVTAPFYEVVGDGNDDLACTGRLIAATPVMYCVRRFGEDCEYWFDGTVLRVVHAGRVVAIINSHASDDLELADAA
jgi:hypothetical protein